MEPQPRVPFIILSIPVLGYCHISYAPSDITASVFTLGGSTCHLVTPPPGARNPSRIRQAISGTVSSLQGDGTRFQRGLARAITYILCHRWRNLLRSFACRRSTALAIPTV